MPRVSRLALWIVLVSAAPGAAVPTDYLISTWQTDEGLPENSATSMVQTPDGHLWFGTFNGLVRFDGLRFTVFDRTTTPELPTAEIVNLHLDRDGRLWVSTGLGMACVKDGRWTVFRHGRGWTGNYARFFAEPADGGLYVATFDNKLLQLGPQGFAEVAPPAPLRTPRWSAFHPFVDETGTLWVSGPGFVGRHVDGRWEERRPAAGWDDTTEVAPARGGGFWQVSHGHLRRFQKGRLTFETAAPPVPRPLWHLFEDSAGRVWLSTAGDGLHQFDPREGWRHFDTGNGLSFSDVRFVFEDREENLWIGTSGGGLQRFRPRFFENWGVDEGLTPLVKGVAVDSRGGMAVATFGGGVLRRDGSRFAPVTRPGSTRSLATHTQSVLFDGRRRLWVGAYDLGLMAIDGGRLRELGVTRAGGIGDWEPGRDFVATGGLHVFSLLEDSRRRLWAGTERGVVRLDGEKIDLLALPGVTPEDSFRALAEDARTGRVWAGHHSRGLYGVHEDRLEPWARSPHIERISSLLADADGTLWIGTEDSGLGCLRGGNLTSIGEQEGLPARRIGALVDDGHGFLWLASNRGLIRVPRDDLEDVITRRSPALRRAQLFNRSDGLATLECSIGYQPAAVRDGHGRLWFATAKGLTTVDPSRLRTNARPPPVVLQEITVDGRPAAVRDPFTTTAALASPRALIPAGARRVEIRYAGLSFQAPEKMRFRYRLVGLDEDWVDVGDRRVAYFQELPPGRYEFQVKAANNDGVWNEAGASVVFELRPFVWQTFWFRALAAGLLLGATGLAVWAGMRLRVRRALERLAQRRALEHARARLALVLETTSDLVAFSDEKGDVLYVNPAGLRLLGLERVEPRALQMDDLLAPASAEVVRGQGVPHALAHGLWAGESVFRGAGGREIPMSQVVAAHRAADGAVEFVSTIARDISDIKGALREKELLLKEVHHRVKNNLQVIASLLSLQSRHVGEPRAVRALEESRNRVRSIALAHERLYLAPSLARVDAAEYVRSVAEALIAGYEASARLELRVDAESLELGIDTAAPCGLIVNELVTNALEHAFPNGRRGRITLCLRPQTGGRWRLRVSDDGVGWPPELDFRETRTLGLQLAVTLAEQIGGTLERLPGAGTTFELEFAEVRYKARL